MQLLEFTAVIVRLSPTSCFHMCVNENSCSQPGEMPCVINGWRTMQKISPYRVFYGSHNPAMHGLILTNDAVIPNFSWTPRLAMEPNAMQTLLTYATPSDILVLPAITGKVVRVFYHDARWYIAGNRSVEVVPTNRHDLGPLCEQFQSCLALYCKRRLWKFLGDLQPDRVWFFGLYNHPLSMVHLGTCAIILQSNMRNAQCGDIPNLDFNVHQHLAPCIPILPEITAEYHNEYIHNIFDPCTLELTGQYDGLFLVNPVTMFGVRLSIPEVVFLDPLLQKDLDVLPFLTAKVVEASMMEISRINTDRMSRRWWENEVPDLLDRYFAQSHGTLIQQIYWQVDTMPQWVNVWMDYITSLCQDEWNQLDLDLQRLYLLLDYAATDDITNRSSSWLRILKHPKYTEWVAKVITFTMLQDAAFRTE